MARAISITLLLMVIIIRKQAGVEATFDFDGKGKKGGSGGYDDGGYGGGYGGGGYGYDDHGGGYGHDDGYGGGYGHDDGYGKGGGKGTGTACIVKGSYCQCHYCKVSILFSKRTPIKPDLFQCEHGYLNCGKGRSKGGKGGGGYGGGEKGGKGGGGGYGSDIL